MAGEAEGVGHRRDGGHLSLRTGRQSRSAGGGWAALPAAGGGALPLGRELQRLKLEAGGGHEALIHGWPATVPVTCTFMTIPTLAPTAGIPVAFWTSVSSAWTARRSIVAGVVMAGPVK